MTYTLISQITSLSKIAYKISSTNRLADDTIIHQKLKKHKRRGLRSSTMNNP